ncbi:MAG: hypothetical protein M3Q33_07580 [Acidobacteriota bacterium]|nr:hypothetical protein [Acidobacteriota bacterium]
MENYELRITNYKSQIAKILCIFCILCASFFAAKAQSTNQNYPTAITTSEISGKIPARDIGDARLTSYFYIFNGNQGDVFINVQTSNFNGDVDVFTAENLRPLTKITIYADLSENETGRVVYLRKPEKLVLRIEGRSPNDDAATFKIKFAGSFAAITNVAETDTPNAPEVKTEYRSDVRVNSVGTIIEVKPKPTPKPKETIAKIEPKKADTSAENKEQTIEKKAEETDTAEKAAADKTTIIIEKTAEPEMEKPVEIPKESKTEVVITDELAKPDVNKAGEENKAAASTKITIEKTPEIAETKTVEKKSKPSRKPAKSKEPNPLENIRLIVLFKDGTKIERPMSDVLKVSVDKGILTVISKTGSVRRYSILDVAKMTIE